MERFVEWETSNPCKHGLRRKNGDDDDDDDSKIFAKIIIMIMHA